jgi:hypothetical protein
MDQCTLRDAQLLADILQKLAATAAIVVGGTWAYFRFIWGRTLKRRLEIGISGEAIRLSGKIRIIVTASAKNIGLTKVELDLPKTGLRVLTQSTEAPVDLVGTDAGDNSGGKTTSQDKVEGSKYMADWELLDTMSVFTQAPTLEPNEPALDQLLVEIPDGGFYAVRLELWVAQKKRRLRKQKWWRATAVVRTVAGVDNSNDEPNKGQKGD